MENRLILGFVVGLRAEARVANRLGPVGIGGGTPEGAARAAASLAPAVDALVSFGLAGGLDPALSPGALIVTSEIVRPSTRARGRAILAAEAPVARAADKRALFAETAAAAVDLESGAVAAIASARGLPFLAVRAVCDPADRDLPPAALAALDRRGAIGLARVAMSVLASPGQLPALAVLARDAARARRALLAFVRRPDARASLTDTLRSRT